MAAVTLTNISVLDNPTVFTNPFQFEVTFECIQQLDDDLEWKIVYVGSAENEAYDQVLEEVLVGPIPIGTNKFVFQANPPNLDLVPEEDRIGVTVVLVTCSYMDKEFVRVGYYVNIGYADAEMQENPPAKIDISKLQRNILADKPRVTRFPIDWTDRKLSGKMFNPEDDQMMDDGDLMSAAAQIDGAENFIVSDEEADLLQDYEDEEDEDDIDMEDANGEIDLTSTP